MPEETVETLLAHLEEKVKQELEEHHVYEALQYVQSFVARKKKVLGIRGVSSAVFLGARLLVNDSSADGPNVAGNLLKWFIEDGAGSDHPFFFLSEQLNSSNYCDTQNLLEWLNSLPPVRAGPVVAVIYNPFHLLVTKRKVKRHSPLALRINKLEIAFAAGFLAAKHFHQAFKCYSRLDDAERLCLVLNRWAEEGYQSEKPLFFGRALLTLLGDNKVSLARDLLFACQSHVPDNIAPESTTGGPLSAALSVYHVGVTLTELAALPPHDRVNKPRLFGIVYRRYAPLLAHLDTRLLELIVKVGETLFQFDGTGLPGGSAPREAGPSPMALLQQMLTGGQPSANAGGANNGRGAGAAPGGGGGFDMNAIMNLLGRIPQTR